MWSFIALLLAFVAVTLYSERQNGSDSDLHRLYKSRINDPRTPAAPKLQVVHEVPVAETTVDPLSLRDATTPVDLGVAASAPPLDGTATVAQTSSTTLPVNVPPLAVDSNRRNSRFKITGGPEGVQIAAH